MIERIFKNTKTTIAGCIIYISALTLVLLDKATLPQMGAFLVTGLGLLFAKDPRRKPKSKNDG